MRLSIAELAPVHIAQLTVGDGAVISLCNADCAAQLSQCGKEHERSALRDDIAFVDRIAAGEVFDFTHANHHRAATARGEGLCKASERRFHGRHVAADRGANLHGHFTRGDTLRVDANRRDAAAGKSGEERSRGGDAGEAGRSSRCHYIGSPMDKACHGLLRDTGNAGEGARVRPVDAGILHAKIVLRRIENLAREVV